jgi:cyclopropane fatty-acyl-phospholipid synthase-like methyltransferase
MDFFDSAYQGTPPWDIGRPQKEFIDLVERGEISGSVLDIGCGSGDNALFFAQAGFEAWGIDSSPLAIQKAQQKGAQRGLTVHFQVLNALELATISRTFDTATDSGLFHTLSDADRPLFVKSLAAVLSSHGTYFMLCFSDKEPAGYGPRRITEQEIRETFSKGWLINYLRPATFESNIWAKGPRAWLSSISRTR